MMAKHKCDDRSEITSSYNKDEKRKKMLDERQEEYFE